MSSMTSSKPYLVRAIYEWIVDNGFTPYLLVDATVAGVLVPQEHIDDGKIVLNIHPNALGALDLGNEQITFDARFSGQTMNVFVPANAVLAIYAKENGQGMMFSLDSHGSDSETFRSKNSSKARTKPNLRIVD